ncbi:MAG: SUMF1/EgtB/PvdO family nonheme iron enzyme [Roseivirga sp.]
MKRSLIEKIATYNFQIFIFGLLIVVTTSCVDNGYPTATNPGKRSRTTGALYNVEGGLEVPPFRGEIPPSGMVYIPGGTTILGDLDENAREGNNPAHRVTLTAFYADQTVVTNIDWREFVKAQEEISEEAHKAAQQDPAIFNAVAHNDALKNYPDAPGFNFYPALVSYVQAEEYCRWRTDRINKERAEKAGEEYDPETGDVPSPESGLVISPLTLPTEAQWEYMARGEIGTLDTDLVQETQRVYGWNGLSLREQSGPNEGKLLANVKRGLGDYKGLPGESDSICPTFYVFSGAPNDWGLFIANGNVREMVVGTHRPNSSQDGGDMNPVMPDLILDAQEDYKVTYPLVSDDTITVKGAAWGDCGHWLKIGERRYRGKEEVDAMTGFRCVTISTSSE